MPHARTRIACAGVWPLAGRTNCFARFLTARIHTFNCHVPRNYIVAGLSAGWQLAPLALRTVCVHGAGFSLRPEPLGRPAIYSLAFALLGMSLACVTIPELIPLHLPQSNYIVAAIVSRSSHRQDTHLHGDSTPYPPNFKISMISAGFPTNKNSLHYCAPIVNTLFGTLTQGKG